MDELTREFLIESQEGLDRMERCLTDLEERPQDNDLIGDIFRSVHTIKGTTGFLGFKRLEKLAHAGENLLGLLRDGKLSANQAIITGLLQLMDALRGILRIIETHNHEAEGADLQGDAALIAHLNELQRPEAATITVASGSTAQSAAVHEPPAHLTHPAVKSAPPAIPDSDTAPAPAAKAAIAVPDAPKAPTEGPDPGKPKAAAASDSTLRVDVVLLNRMMNLVGELVLTRNQILQATSTDPNFTMLS